MKTRYQLVPLKIVVWVVVIVAMLAGCKSRQQLIAPTKTVEIEKIVTKTVRDTTFVIDADSSFYHAWIECVNNKPVLRQPTSQAGINLKSPIVDLTDTGELYVECQTEILELHARIEDLVTELNYRSVEYVPIEVERELTFWQRFFIGLGRVLFVGLVGTAVYGAIKLYKKLF